MILFLHGSGESGSDIEKVKMHGPPKLVAGGKVYKGRQQILALMRETMQKRGGKAKLTVTTTDVWLDVDTAYETGTAVYEFTVNGQPQTLERRYFTIWKRQSKRGSWKIYSNTGIAKQ